MNNGNREEYDMLLGKFCANEDIYKLIEECILDEVGKIEYFYERHKTYPVKRDLLGKLKSDLAFKRREGLYR